MSQLGVCGPCLLLVALLVSHGADGQVEARDYTCFQTGDVYAPELDIASDLAIVYGGGDDFAARAEGWKNNGYAIGMMTGIAWGGYGDYFGEGDSFKKDEIQTRKGGRLFMHGDSTSIGYNVPTMPYVEYLKRKVTPAIEAGAQAIFLEEPEYWAQSGWSAAFKSEWLDYYGEAWQEPDSSPDAQYRASKLKYELYFRALQHVFQHAKAVAAQRGAEVECHVPTHSLINYAHWGIVSPESHLMDLKECDGYIAQVWTGTARTPNYYQGVKKERSFEAAYLEYGQMLGMVRPTGRKVWFLADPIEDNPNYSWNNYKYNYECTIIASLLWPEVHHYEVMPWPSRIFRGQYPKVDLDTKSGEKEGIPAEYATELLAVINALNEMKQEEVVYDAGTRGIGVIVSDTMMFQRAQPEPSDRDLGSFFALAMPLVKHGIPAEIVQLENTTQPGALDSCKVLLLTYEGQKPLKAEYHVAINSWVRAGGCLLVVDDGADPYNNVREWWNVQATTAAKPLDDLYARLGIGVTARNEPEAVQDGFVRVFAERPRKLQQYEYGARKIVELVTELLNRRGETIRTQNYFRLQRGPFVIASVLDESVSSEPLRVAGHYVDLFDPLLPCVEERLLQPNERALLYDLEWARGKGVRAKVVAASTRIRDEKFEGNRLRFTMRGPAGTTCRARVLLPSKPISVAGEPEVAMEQEWDEVSGTLHLSLPNLAQNIVIDVAL